MRQLVIARSQTGPMRSVAVLGVAVSIFGAAAGAETAWMSQEALRSELTGKQLYGQFRESIRWVVKYRDGGRIDYAFESSEGWETTGGDWYQRGSVLCLRADQPNRGNFGTNCWTVNKASSNCYEYFRVRVLGDEPIEDGSPERSWRARAWRSDEPSTCDAKPSV